MALSETTYVERVLIVLNENGTLKGAHQESKHLVRDGAVIILDRQLEALPLASQTLAGILNSEALAAQIAALQVQVPALLESNASLLAENADLVAEVARLNALLDPPNPFGNADWDSFRGAILSNAAVQRVAAGNSAAWPLMVLYLAELQHKPSRVNDIAALWNLLEEQTPITAEEVDTLNAIAEACAVPLRMQKHGHIDLQVIT